MAVSNSLAKRQETSFTAYLKNDAVKNQINEVVGGKNQFNIKCGWKQSNITGMSKFINSKCSIAWRES